MATATLPKTSRLAAHDLALTDLPGVIAGGVPIPAALAPLKHYDPSHASEDFKKALAAWESAKAVADEAQAAMEAIKQPAPYQPKPKESALFDGLKKEIDSANSQAEYEQMMAAAQRRLSDLQAQILPNKYRAIALAHIADLYDARVRCEPKLQKYAKALAAAQAAKQDLESAIAIEQKREASEHSQHNQLYLPCSLRLQGWWLSGDLPSAPESLLCQGEQDIIPRPLAEQPDSHEVLVAGLSARWN